MNTVLMIMSRHRHNRKDRGGPSPSGSARYEGMLVSKRMTLPFVLTSNTDVILDAEVVGQVTNVICDLPLRQWLVKLVVPTEADVASLLASNTGWKDYSEDPNEWSTPNDNVVRLVSPHT